MLWLTTRCLFDGCLINAYNSSLVAEKSIAGHNCLFILAFAFLYNMFLLSFYKVYKKLNIFPPSLPPKKKKKKKKIP